MHTVKVDEFDGPLDLLLQLIEDRKLQITQVSLVEVTEQYLAVLQRSKAGLERLPPGELADFLAVASRLLLIKSKALLPYLVWEEDEADEAAELERQLKLYKAYADASATLRDRIARRRFGYAREKLVTVDELGFQEPAGVTPRKLAAAFAAVLARIEPARALPKQVIRKTVNIQEKIQQLRDAVWQRATVRFSELLARAKDKTESIVSFLAVLELVKGRQVTVDQPGLFQDFVVKKSEPVKE